MEETPRVPPPLHVADVLEAINDAIPESLAMVWRDVRRTRREFEDRASRLAAAFAAHGLGYQSRVALYLHNSPAYLEGYFAAFKIRGVPVNANYRYKEEELHYLLENADAEAILFDEQLAPRVATIAARLKKVKLFVEVGSSGLVGGSVSLETLLRQHEPMPRIVRDPMDMSMTYTGGTTGMPKGVENKIGRTTRGLLTIAAGFLGAKVPLSSAEAGEEAKDLYARNAVPISVVAPPFMHATGLSYGALVPLMAGGVVHMLPSWSFDAKDMLLLAEKVRATSLTIAGDVIARPLANELEDAAKAGKPYDISSVRVMYSSGMVWTAGTKRVFLKYAPDATLIDVVGSTEGHVGTSFATRSNIPDTGVFVPNPTTKVISTEGREVAPGSGEVGMLACAGDIVGAGYHKDPEKSAKTYRMIDGVNYVMAGDWATVEADGSIRFFGRGSSCINTGGEKVFAEEVENVILRMRQISDCLVVGIPDERWGQVVAAVVSAVSGETLDANMIQEWVRESLAGYKVPRRIAIVERVPRTPNGKADLEGARDIAKMQIPSKEKETAQ